MPMNCFFPHQKERKEKKEKEKMAGNIYRGGMVGGRVLGMMKGRGIMVGGVRNLELKKEEMCFSFSCFGLGRFSSSSTRIETKIIDGRAIANEILDEVKKEAEMLKKETGVVCGLASVLVGDRPDSDLYVESKAKAAERCGFFSLKTQLPSTTTEQDLIQHIHHLNTHPDIHALLLQLPLPSHLNQQRILSEVSVKKDVDGFSLKNFGALALAGATSLPFSSLSCSPLLPCTPAAVLELLGRVGGVEGKRVVMVGKSMVVGMPLMLGLLNANATVTVCHTKTSNIRDILKEGDIVVVAIGCREEIKGEWLRPGCTVIDVGVNIKQGEEGEGGKRKVVGDVDFKSVQGVAEWVTPVPGGVGPMTIAMLMKNTLLLTKQQIKSKE